MDCLMLFEFCLCCFYHWQSGCSIYYVRLIWKFIILSPVAITYITVLLCIFWWWRWNRGCHWILNVPLVNLEVCIACDYPNICQQMALHELDPDFCHVVTASLYYTHGTHLGAKLGSTAYIPVSFINWIICLCGLRVSALYSVMIWRQHVNQNLCIVLLY